MARAAVARLVQSKYVDLVVEVGRSRYVPEMLMEILSRLSMPVLLLGESAPPPLSTRGSSLIFVVVGSSCVRRESLHILRTSLASPAFQ